jgi:hypothetical protein
VLIIDQDVDAALGGRLDRWFDAYNTPGTVYLPLVMVDSGDQISNGDTSFSTVYGGMLDNALQRPATARMAVQTTQIGNLLRFEVSLTNASGETLSAANDATLTALLYQQPASASAIPVVAAAGATAVTTLADGETGAFTFEVATGSLDPDRIGWVVIADYLPSGSGSAYDTLQAVAGP